MNMAKIQDLNSKFRTRQWDEFTRAAAAFEDKRQDYLQRVVPTLLGEPSRDNYERALDAYGELFRTSQSLYEQVHGDLWLGREDPEGVMSTKRLRATIEALSPRRALLPISSKEQDRRGIEMADYMRSRK